MTATAGVVISICRYPVKIETAKLNGLNPGAYLAYAIDQLARGLLASRISELLPWNCKDAVAAWAG